jgi:hypothetical protein
MKIIYSDAEIKRIALAVQDRTLPKSDWTHAAHFAAALWLLNEPARDVVAEMPGLIRAYNEASGVANTDSTGYHETITFASLRAAHAWLRDRTHLPLHLTLETLLASQFGKPDWVFAYWSKPVLFSANARRRWVEPDLQALPFGEVRRGK